MPAKDFGAEMDYPMRTTRLVLASPEEGCQPLDNGAELAGQVAMIRRGCGSTHTCARGAPVERPHIPARLPSVYRLCSFVEKSHNAQQAGAAAVIVFDSVETNDGRWIEMVRVEDDFFITIPAFFMLGRDGYHAAWLFNAG